ncbi:beta-ketoacyl synthase [Striga asiatica]|uniref:Beta-ketoacyl synthase n=1 Tax=Striga asiatica TaxID=4170 RepID=A0A5A7R7P1_STRAF|nr:beta-ketoacyl synthase [Striga asiatica]
MGRGKDQPSQGPRMIPEGHGVWVHIGDGGSTLAFSGTSWRPSSTNPSGQFTWNLIVFGNVCVNEMVERKDLCKDARSVGAVLYYRVFETNANINPYALRQDKFLVMAASTCFDKL